MQGFKGLLADLDALFGAEVARQEDEAADDLAISLKADRHFAEALIDDSFELVMDERRVAVETVGLDFVQCGEFLVPFGRFHFVSSAGEPPRSVNLRFVDRMRDLARVGSAVELGLSGQTLQGPLISVAPDHLVVEVRAGVAVIPIGSVSWVRLFPEGSTDVS